MSTPQSFDWGCSTLLLTIKKGPNSGTTLVDCTCGWKHVYKTRHKAEKRERQHLALTGTQPNKEQPKNEQP